MPLSVIKGLRQAESHLKKNEIIEAETIYRKILKKYPKNKAAIREYQKLKVGLSSKDVLATEPPHGRVQELIGLYNLSRFEEVISKITPLMALFPKSIVLKNLVAASNAGLKKFDQAIEQFYKILEINPTDAVTHYNIGNIQKEKGDLNAEIESYEHAIRIKPNYAEAHNNMGSALKLRGDLSSAIKKFEDAIKIKHQFPEAHYNLGVALQESGQIIEAIKSYENACKLKRNYTKAHFNMGNALKDIGSLENSVQSYEKALKINPNFVEVYINLGKALHDLGKLDEAIDIYNQAIVIKSDYLEAYVNKGNVSHEKGDLKDAIESFTQAIKIKPDYAEAHNNLGYALRDFGDFEFAIESYKKAIEIKPDYAEAYGNMGIAHRDNSDLIKAIESFNQAIKIKPEFSDVYNNLGAALRDAGDLDAAIESYQKALRINPDYAMAHWNQSLAYLTKADFQNGWLAYEWRWKATDEIGKYLSTSKPIWRSSKGQRVLLWAEQGVGDEVMFASIIPDLHAVCSKLIVQIDERLIPLFRRSFPSDIDYRTRDEVVSENYYDAHIPMGSLPQQFRQTIESFKSTSLGWLSACDVKVNSLREKLITDKSETLIGISWHSTKPRLGAEAKVISLIQLAKKLHAPKTKLVNLQYGDVSDELSILSEEHGIEIIQLPEVDNKNDIDGLAALIMACDKVVSISNLTIHLAGALGKEAHVLLASSNDWRWGQNRNSSYWYDSVHLHRQTKINDWDAVLKLL